jgi:hypothetical protein
MTTGYGDLPFILWKVLFVTEKTGTMEVKDTTLEEKGIII